MKKKDLASTFPELAKEWHTSLNGDLKPSDFSYGSKKKVWWKCPKGDDHEWESTINNRTRKKKPSGCACCAGTKVCKDNQLDLLFPEVAKEWHPSLNGDLKPSDFSYGTRKQVWWKCPKGEDHEWKTGILNRTTGDTSCPKCKPQTSKAEIRILSEIMFLFKDVKSRHKIKNKEVDVFLPLIKLGIEFDGLQVVTPA